MNVCKENRGYLSPPPPFSNFSKGKQTMKLFLWKVKFELNAYWPMRDSHVIRKEVHLRSSKTAFNIISKFCMR